MKITTLSQNFRKIITAEECIEPKINCAKKENKKLEKYLFPEDYDTSANNLHQEDLTDFAQKVTDYILV